MKNKNNGVNNSNAGNGNTSNSNVGEEKYNNNNKIMGGNNNMSKFGKKMVVGALAVAMMIGGLVGCGKKQDKVRDSQTVSVSQKGVDAESVKKSVKKGARSANELLESLKAVDVKGGKVIGEGGKELSKDEVKEIAKLYASKDEKVVSKSDREKIENMVNATFGKDEGKKILDEYKNDKKLEEKIKEEKPVGNEVKETSKANNSNKASDGAKAGKTNSGKANNNEKAGDKTSSKTSDNKSNNASNRVSINGNNNSNNNSSNATGGNKKTGNSSGGKKSNSVKSEAVVGDSKSNTKKPSVNNQNVNKKVDASVTKPAQKEDVVEYKNETERYNIDFKVVDNYASSGGESRVYQTGSNGVGEKVYKVKYVNGVRQGRELVSDNTITAPQDQIIERYVKVQDEKWETKEVENKDKPIYEEKWVERWFVRFYNAETGEDIETRYYYTSKEAYDAYVEIHELNGVEVLSNWGTAEDECVGKEIVGYETTTQNVKVQDAKYEWKH